MNSKPKVKSSRVAPVTSRKATVMGQRKKKKLSCSQTLNEQLKSLDIYGEQVRLTYKGEDTFKTSIGSIVSILLIMVLLAYGVFRFYLLVTLQDSVFNGFDYIVDLTEAGEFKPQEMGFDVAVGFSRDLDPSYAMLTAKHVRFYYKDELNEDGERVRVKEKLSLELEKCGTEYFNFTNQEEVQTYGLDKYYCIKNKSYAIEGDYYAEGFQYLEVKLWKCQNSSYYQGCQDQDKIDKYFFDATMSWAFVNTNFDFNDYQDSLKYFIDDSLFWIIEPDRIKYTNFYIMQADAELEDAYLQFGQQKNLDFYRVKNYRSYSGSYSDDEGFVCAVYIRFDKFQQTQKRQIYSFLTLLGDIGGLQSSIYIIGFLAVSFFQQRMFISQIIKNIYQVKKLEGKFEEQSEAEIDKQFEDNLKGRHDSDLIDRGSRQPSPKGSFIMRQLSGRDGNGMNRSQLDQTNNPLQGKNGIDVSLWDGPQDQTLNVHSRTQHKHQTMSPRLTPSSSARKIQGPLSEVDQKVDMLSVSTIYQILRSMINRQRFNYNFRLICQYLTKCMCCRNLEKYRQKENYKQHFLYSKARDKLLQELDVINMVRSIRKLKLVTQTLLTQKHRMLLRFQRQNLVETESSSGDSDDNRFDTLRLMENKHPMIRLIIFGKLKRMMMSYRQQKVTKIDHKLLKGVFMRKIKDFDDEQREIFENRSLMSRIHGTIFVQKEQLDQNEGGSGGVKASTISVDEEASNRNQLQPSSVRRDILQKKNTFQTPSLKFQTRLAEEKDDRVGFKDETASLSMSMEQQHPFHDFNQKSNGNQSQFKKNQSNLASDQDNWAEENLNFEAMQTKQNK